MRRNSVERLGNWMEQVVSIDRKLEECHMSLSKRSRVLTARRYLVGKINTVGVETFFNMALMSGDPKLLIRAIRTPGLE